MKIADTPGLIYRPDAKRNAIEHLALAMIEKTKAVRGVINNICLHPAIGAIKTHLCACRCLSTSTQSIGFVFDPTGSSGTSVEDQLLLRDELHGRVAKVRDDLAWLDIISKVDQPIPDLKSLQRRLGPASLSVSAQTNQGLVELGDEIRSVLVAPYADGDGDGEL